MLYGRQIDQETVLQTTRLEMASRFSEAGAEFIHGGSGWARSGGERNLATIKNPKAASKIPIESGRRHP